MRVTAINLVIALILLSGQSAAHPELEYRIAEVTKRIAADPTDAAQYLRRAGLHAEHGDFTAAFDDLASAEERDAEHSDLLLWRARILDLAGDRLSALKDAEAFLASQPAHVGARFLQARILGHLGRMDDFVRVFDATIALTARPSADLYLERARILETGSDARPNEALAGLYAGIDRLGPLVTLIDAVARRETSAGRPEAAIAVIDRLPAQVAETPAWRMRRAELLVALGEGSAAKTALIETLAAIRKLSDNRRLTPAMTELRKRAAARLAELLKSP